MRCPRCNVMWEGEVMAEFDGDIVGLCHLCKDKDVFTAKIAEIIAAGRDEQGFLLWAFKEDE